MELEFVPLLRTQRDLYRLPRGRERFEAYLREMVNDDARDLRLPPLVMMNPMGTEHVPALLDALCELDAEDVAARAVAEAAHNFADEPGEFKVGLVVADDAQGGWTNRYTTEFSMRFECGYNLRRGWLSVALWTSEEPAARTVREEVLASVYRAVYIRRHGFARTLGEMMAQEGYASASAGATIPALDADDLAYTREIVAPLCDARDRPTVIACLYGDAAARALGYPPQGLSDRAGLALALAAARGRIELAGTSRFKPRGAI